MLKKRGKILNKYSWRGERERKKNMNTVSARLSTKKGLEVEEEGWKVLRGRSGAEFSSPW